MKRFPLAAALALVPGLALAAPPSTPVDAKGNTLFTQDNPGWVTGIAGGGGGGGGNYTGQTEAEYLATAGNPTDAAKAGGTNGSHSSWIRQIEIDAAAILARMADGNQKTQITSMPAITGTVAVSNFPGTQAVSAAALPLPSGAATAANQTNGNAVTQVSSLPPIPAGTAAIGTVAPTPTAPAPLSGGTIAAANTWQQVAAAGACKAGGTIEDVSAPGTASFVVGFATGIAAGGTVRGTGGLTVDPPNVAGRAGGQRDIPPTTNGVFVYGPAGALFQGFCS